MDVRTSAKRVACLVALVVVARRAPAQVAPSAPGFRILGAYLAEDGRHVLFNAYDEAGAKPGARMVPEIVGMVVDLQTRECRALGDRLVVVGPSRRVDAREATRAPRYSGFNAQVIDESSGPVAIDSGGRRTGSAAVKSAPYDGSPGAAEIGFDARYRVVVPLGLGYGVVERNAKSPAIACFDPFRRRTFDSAPLFPGQPSALSRTWIRRGSWLVRRAASADYELLDPETGRSEAPQGLSSADEIALGLTDGRFVVTSAGSVAVWSPDTGLREAIALRDVTVKQLAPTEHFYRCDPAVPSIVHVQGATWSGLARLDLPRKELVPALGSKGRVVLVATLDGDDVLALEDGRRLVRLTIGSAKVDVVVPAR